MSTQPLTSLDALTETELDHAIGAAIIDHSPELPALEQERDRRQHAAERQRLADAEGQRRANVAAQAEQAALLATLEQQLADLEAAHRADLNELERTPQREAYAVCERAYRSGRVAFSFAHDLHGITGDRRFHRIWSVPDSIMLCGGQAGAAFMMSIRGRPPRVETPGEADLARLRELMGPRPTAIGNGG